MNYYLNYSHNPFYWTLKFVLCERSMRNGIEESIAAEGHKAVSAEAFQQISF